jgi:transcriptional regulator with XRE-family HTH domain
VTPEQATPPAGTLAGKLDHLFRTVKAPSGRPWTHKEVAGALRAAGGPTISATYLWQLRSGQRTDPRMSHLDALARHFGVAPAYFFADELADRFLTELVAVAALRSPEVRQVAEFAAQLHPDSVALLRDLADHLLTLERPPVG